MFNKPIFTLRKEALRFCSHWSALRHYRALLSSWAADNSPLMWSFEGEIRKGYLPRAFTDSQQDLLASHCLPLDIIFHVAIQSRKSHPTLCRSQRTYLQIPNFSHLLHFFNALHPSLPLPDILQAVNTDSRGSLQQPCFLRFYHLSGI